MSKLVESTSYYDDALGQYAEEARSHNCRSCKIIVSYPYPILQSAARGDAILASIPRRKIRIDPIARRQVQMPIGG